MGRAKRIFIAACVILSASCAGGRDVEVDASSGGAPDVGAAGASANAGADASGGGAAGRPDVGGATGEAGASGGTSGAVDAGLGGNTGADAGPEPVVDWVTNPAGHVSTTVGTTSGGDTFPGADFPFGMVQWSPDTTPTRPSGGGYDYKDTNIIGFSLTHLSGPGCSGALGDVPILPLTGGLPSGDLNAVKQPFSHAGEIGKAGFYSVQLGNPAIKTELTATLHGAMARFTFPTTNNANLLFKLRDSANGNDKFGDSTAAIVGSNEVTGSTTSGGFCGTGTPYVLYFDVVFDRPFTASQVIAAPGKAVPGFVFLTFDASKTAVVQAKVGVSFVSVANARANWTAEIPAAQWSFDVVQVAAVAAWSRTLGRIEISGGTATEQELFYTSLYHSLLHPNVATDTNGQYMGFDKKVHSVTGTQREQYVNFSGWDIYHCQVQLASLVAPKTMSDVAQSMLNDAAQHNGSLPRWALEYGENGIMPGDPGPAIIAGIHAFGAKDFDTAKALDVMVKEATVPNDVRWGLAQYTSLGYVPDDIGQDQAGGMSLEYNQSDFAISRFASALGDAATAATMLQHAQSWQNLFDPSVDMFIPKRKDGTFAPGVGPTSSHGLTEGDASQYRWVIAFNRQAQLAAMGGSGVANPALDAFFSKLSDYQGAGALMTNEFELGAPYWNNHTGMPWKTQEIVNRVRTQLYHDAPKFIDGTDTNDDLGALSSALAWSMLGLYPSYPGSAILAVNGPEFAHERIHLPSGASLTLHAAGASATTPYIQSLVVDGRVSDRPWLDASVIDAGATLAFAMGATPNQSWGADGADPLTAAGQESLSAFVYAAPSATGVAPNPLVLAPGASVALTLIAKSARADKAQKVAWTVAPGGLSLDVTTGSFDLAAGAQATAKVTVKAPSATGAYLVRFTMTSSLGVNPPPYVLPVTVK